LVPDLKFAYTQGQIPPNVIHGESPGQQQETEQNTEVEKEIIPVVIRPGHIRFQPLGKRWIPSPSPPPSLKLIFKVVDVD